MPQTSLQTYELSRPARDALRADTLDALYQGVVVTDPGLPDNPIVYANEAFLTLTGYTREEIIGFNCRFLQGPGTDDATVERLRRTLVAGGNFFGELLNFRKDGTPFWNALSITTLRDGAGAITHFVASQTDVTPLKELQLRAEQQQRLELLGTFAGGIAHDFNNVLLASMGYAELLISRLDGDPALQGYATQIAQAAETGRRLTAQLLAFSKGDRETGPAQTDVVTVAAQTAALAQRLMPAGVAIELDLPESALAAATHSQLEQVMLNLVVNARDAIEGKGTIMLSVRRLEEQIEIAVADTGSGMTDDVREQIFEAFFTTKGSGEGTGLGLATVNGIVASVGGTIEVRSALGQGTTFLIVLPAA